MAKNYRAAIVASALSYVGTTGGTSTGDDKFIRYYNNLCKTSFSLSTTPWCAIFATYNERTQSVPTSICPTFASCTALRDSFLIPKGYWKLRTSGYSPKPADLIFFNWNGNMSGKPQHVGIVEKRVGNLVYTIEGNSGSPSRVRHKSYDISCKYILAYGAIPYEKIGDNSAAGYSGNMSTSSGNATATGYSVYIKNFQNWLNRNYHTNIKSDGYYGPNTRKAATIALQTYLAKNFSTSLKIDGIFGTKTRSACPILTYNAAGTIVYMAQGMLYCHGISAGGFDGKFGPLMKTAIGLYEVQNGLAKTYTVSPSVWTKLFTT